MAFLTPLCESTSLSQKLELGSLKIIGFECLIQGLFVVGKHGRDWEIGTENWVESIQYRFDFDSSRFGLKSVNIEL